MPAPLVAASLAARLIARQLAEKSAKKIATKAVKKTVTKVAPKSSVKVAKPSTLRKVKNQTSNITSELRKSGEAAKRSAADVRTGMPNATVKIKSGGNIKPAFPKKAKPMSYSQLKDMPNLVKIDSAKGNTVKKIAYRKRTSN